MIVECRILTTTLRQIARFSPDRGVPPIWGESWYRSTYGTSLIAEQTEIIACLVEINFKSKTKDCSKLQCVVISLKTNLCCLQIAARPNPGEDNSQIATKYSVVGNFSNRNFCVKFTADLIHHLHVLILCRISYQSCIDTTAGLLQRYQDWYTTASHTDSAKHFCRRVLGPYLVGRIMTWCAYHNSRHLSVILLVQLGKRNSDR